MSDDGFDGLLNLVEQLEGYLDKMDSAGITDILEAGAEALTSDIHKVPRPRSNISGGHTHMLDSISYSKDLAKSTVEVGWGVYYGHFIENGTSKMGAQPHLKPTFEKNKKRYYQMMIDKFHEK